MLDVNELDLFYGEQDEPIGQMVGASSTEVLIACLNKLGRVDIVEMSNASGKSPKTLVDDLGGSAIFQDPEEFEYETKWSIEKGWIFCATYCSGNINKKLETAKRMNKKFPGRFKSNIAALKKYLPTPMCLSDIYASPGVLWVDAQDYAEFAKELFDLEYLPDVIYDEQVRKWKIVYKYKKTIALNEKYGNADMSGIEILECTMNGKTVKVFDYIPRRNWQYEPVLNKESTIDAQQKEKLIIREFNKWIHKDPERAVRLEENYNDMFVCFGTSSYDGSFLELPDLNRDVTLFSHQRSAIARMIMSPENLLLAHNVGAGKTYEICVGVHELYRMNISRKNLVVAPNNVIGDIVKAHKYLYPNDKILTVFPKDFTPKNRQKILETIRDGDFVAVFMAYSSFDLIVMSKDYWLNKMTNEINSVKRAIANSSNKTQKSMLERRHKSLLKKRSKYLVEGKDTPWLNFEELGIETLCIDESHNYKNAPIESKTDNIIGMHTEGSKKSKELVEKSKVVKKLVFATGTPTPNSLADLFVLQMFLQPDELKFRGLDNIDVWFNTFCEKETNFEIDVTGRQLRLMTRFCKFHNLTELMALFSTVCDFYYSFDDDAELPAFDGYTDIIVPMNKAQESYIKQLSFRTDRIREGKVPRSEDNLLKVTVNGRECALDIRLVNPFYIPDCNEVNKITACADKVYEIYSDYPNTCQAVFSDIGTPKESFNVYDELKRCLIERGVPAHQIAFVHEATSESAREKLFGAINGGNIRVVIGSTTKLGVGVNVQERLKAIHHLSIPWRPNDIVQREGRILRRGNTCKDVIICRYITRGSFDAYSWQLLQTKQRFISEILSGSLVSRDADDVSDTVLNYAEIKALAVGNDNIRYRLETENLLEYARVNYRARQKQLEKLRVTVDNAPKKIEQLKENHRIITLDATAYAREKTTIAHDERLSFGEELLDALSDNVMQSEARLFDSYQGFDIRLPANMDEKFPHIYIISKNGGEYYLKMDSDKPLGCCMKIDRFLDGLSKNATQTKKDIEFMQKETQKSIIELEIGNCYENEVERLQKQLADIDKQLAKEGIAV